MSSPSPKKQIRRVIVESPFAGPTQPHIERNLRYVRACMRDCLLRGEAPFASHALYTQPGVLQDRVPSERALGMSAGFAWRGVASATVVYTDLGLSSGMLQSVAHALSIGHPVEYRTLPSSSWGAEEAETSTSARSALRADLSHLQEALMLGESAGLGSALRLGVCVVMPGGPEEVISSFDLGTFFANLEKVLAEGD